MPDRPLRFVIIGNGAAGTTAAETLRKLDANCQITLITDEPYPLYNRVALPRFLKEKVPEAKVIMRSIDDHTSKGIALLLETRVETVLSQEKKVRTTEGTELPYDKLLVASGGRPNSLPVPGSDAINMMYFQSLDDSKAILSRIKESRQAVTVGGSYISYELTEAFRGQGLEVTWLIRGPRFLRRILDEEGGALVDLIASQHGVEVVHGEEVASVSRRDGLATGVETTAGRHVTADIIGCGLGLTLNTEFLKDSGIKVGTGVITDERLQTSDPDIYAAGDVAEFFDVVLGTHNVMGTWDNSLAHGRLAATNMLGGNQVHREVPTYTTTMFDTTMSVLGITPESHAEVKSASRVDMKNRSLRQLFFLNNRLVGAIMIRDMKGRRKLLEIIKAGGIFEGTPLSLFEE